MLQEATTAVINFLENKLKRLEAQIKLTNKKASDSPGAMESWSDKSKDEFSQLAGALSKEIEPIKATIKALKTNTQNSKGKVALGSLVTLSKDEASEEYLLIPDNGGDEIALSTEKRFFLLSLKSDESSINKKNAPSDYSAGRPVRALSP